MTLPWDSSVLGLIFTELAGRDEPGRACGPFCHVPDLSPTVIKIGMCVLEVLVNLA